MFKNYSIAETISKLKPLTKDMPFAEQSQLEGLVRDMGYLGALVYLDPSIPRPWNPDRNGRMVESHFNILLNL